jgi:hypothetical protein
MTTFDIYTHKNNVKDQSLESIMQANKDISPLVDAIKEKGLSKAMEDSGLSYKKFQE